MSHEGKSTNKRYRNDTKDERFVLTKLIENYKGEKKW